MQQCNQECSDSLPLDGPAYGSQSSAIVGNPVDFSDASSCSSTHSTQRSVRLSLSSPSPQRTWTLFTQLMENRGQLNQTSLSLDLNATSPHTTSPSTPAELSHTSILYPPHTSFAASSKRPDNIEEGHEVHDSGRAFSRPQPESSKPSLKDLTRRWFSLPLHRSVLKCSIAYFVASLFTFCPYLSALISDLVSYGPGRRAPTPSGHMVATM